jgi:hypothetical protein
VTLFNGPRVSGLLAACAISISGCVSAPPLDQAPGCVRVPEPALPNPDAGILWDVLTQYEGPVGLDGGIAYHGPTEGDAYYREIEALILGLEGYADELASITDAWCGEYQAWPEN